MREDDRFCSLVLLGIALAACLGASQHDVGTFNNPGSGFFPMVLGIVLGILSLIILAGGVIAKRAATTKQLVVKKRSFFTMNALIVVAVLICYGLLLVPLGFIVTTFLLFTALFKFVADQKWLPSLGEALALSLGSYIIFEVLLGVPLPYGIIAFS